ncbi:MAG: 30S ribosomal protein S8e [Candidatus Micrarchaeia archaeon]
MSQFGVQIHKKTDRKLSGNGKLKLKSRDKKRHEVGGYFSATRLGKENATVDRRVRGGAVRKRLKYALYANLITKDGFKKVKINAILESPDNRNFARLNIMTKGTVIDTEAGKAKIINRPGREGNVVAKLLA